MKIMVERGNTSIQGNKRGGDDAGYTMGEAYFYRFRTNPAAWDKRGQARMDSKERKGLHGGVVKVL